MRETQRGEVRQLEFSGETAQAVLKRQALRKFVKECMVLREMEREKGRERKRETGKEKERETLSLKQ